MLDFIKYLKENFNEDTSSVEKIIKSKWDKVVEIIKEAFDDTYVDKKTALYKIQNEFVDIKIAPKTIDVDFLKNNMDYVVEKVNDLNEGEIRIIINNDVHKGASAIIPGIETEGVKKKVGRKKKVVEEADDNQEEEENTEEETGDEIEFGEEEDTGAETEENTDEEKIVKISVKDNKVTVEPSENSGLEKSEYEFETEEETEAFLANLETLFQGFKIEKEEAEESGEEPEDSEAEEPEDSDALNWGDFASSEEEAEEEVSVKALGSKEYDIESLDLTKLINNLVNVKGNWFKVTSITEEKKIVALDKNGKKKSFDFNQIDEMECDFDDMCPKKAEEEVGTSLRELFTPEAFEKLQSWIDNPEGPAAELDDEVYDTLMNYYAEEMPYGTAKARDGDPYEWIYNRVKEELLAGEEEVEVTDEVDIGSEEEVGCAEEEVEDSGEEPEDSGEEPEDSGEEPEDSGEEPEDSEAEEPEDSENVEESLSFANLANRYLDEDSLTPPTMTQTQTGGKTSKVGQIDQTVVSVKPAPKAPIVKAPTAALTANPGKPNQKLEKVPSAPTAQVKKGPSTALTSSPKAPPKKIEKVKAAPKAATKTGPKANLTSKVGKTGQRVEKVKAPQIDKDYKKGGFRG